MQGHNSFKLWDVIKYFFKCAAGRGKNGEEAPPSDEKEDKNPYIGQIREIMEQILEKKKISYECFAPVLIDGADSGNALLAAELLGRDLNRLMILTERPEYFEEYADNMYEEQGLIVEIFSKNRQKIAALSTEEFLGSVILDFEEEGELPVDLKSEKIIYIPVFKRRWERAGNLDIAVPIGYNTMTVRGSETVQKRYCPDRFEQAFYENE